MTSPPTTTTPPLTVNIAARLSESARRYPDKPAVVWPHRRDGYRQISFRQLDELSDAYAQGLARLGIGRGTRTILMVRPGREFFALTFALFKLAAVPVLIDPGLGRRRIVACLARVEAEAFIGVPLAQLVRVLHRGAFRSVRTVVTVGRRWLWGGIRLADLPTRPPPAFSPALTTPEQTAAILFTSGSTGPPKGVIYTHGVLDGQVRYLQSHFGYGPDDVDLATFPLFALFDAGVGMTAVIPDMDPARPGSADPTKIIAAISDWRCTHMFGSPALLERVGRYAREHGIKLPALRRVVTAGAPVRPEILERFAGLLAPEVPIYTPYGATEALPLALISSHEILAETRHQTARGAGVCVGRPLAGIDLRIIEITDEPIATWSEARELTPGEVGEIVVRGPVVTPGYFRDPQADALAKISDDRLPTSALPWHRMGDVGYLDRSGRLWFCGRKSQRVTTPTGTLFTVPCEALFNQHPAVRRSALVGVGPPGRQRAVLCVEPEPGRTGGGTTGRQDNKATSQRSTQPLEHATATPGRSATSRRRERIRAELLAMAKAAGQRPSPAPCPDAGSTPIRPTGPIEQITTVLFHPGFPVDVRHNAKIGREKLARWAARRLGRRM